MEPLRFAFQAKFALRVSNTSFLSVCSYSVSYRYDVEYICKPKSSCRRCSGLRALLFDIY